MGTVVDELILRLSLDPKNFTKGQKEAGAAFLKTRDDAIKSGKDIEAASNKVAASIQKMAREVIALFAVIAGSRSLADLITGLTTANAELGRFSANMAESPQRIAAWEAAAQRFGGTGQATAETIQRMGKALYDLRFQGKALPQAFYQLEAATGRLIETDRGPIAFLEQTSAALKELATHDPSRAFNIAQEMGIDPGTFALMKEQGAAIGEYVAKIEKSISPSEKAIAAAQKLQKAWYELTQQVGSLINRLYELAGPPIAALIDRMTKWLEVNKDWLASEISDKVEKFADYLAQIDWAAVGAGLKNFGDGAKSAADAVGGLTNALEILFGLWAGGKAAKFMFGGASARAVGGVLAGGAGSGAAAAGGGAAVAGKSPVLLGLAGLLGIASLIQPGAKRVEEVHGKPVNPQDWNIPGKLSDWWSGKSTPSNEPDRGDAERQNSLASFLNGPVDGRPVSKSNPLPVAPVTTDAGGGGFWSDLWKGVKSAMSGASAGFMSGGGSLMSAGSGSGSASGGSGKPSINEGGGAKTSVPNIPGMTPDERNKLGLILKYESGGKNVMNYEGRNRNLDPSTAKGYTAQGYYQMLNSNWRRLAPKLGINERNAMAASLVDQTKVALALMRESGIKNWSNFNPSLRQALQRGEKAGAWAERVPTPEPIGVATGAKGSAAISSANNDNRRYSNSVSSQMSIGNMNIHTQAADPHGIADVIWGDIDQRMKQSANATAANFGPA